MSPRPGVAMRYPADFWGALFVVAPPVRESRMVPSRLPPSFRLSASPRLIDWEVRPGASRFPMSSAPTRCRPRRPRRTGGVRKYRYTELQDHGAPPLKRGRALRRLKRRYSASANSNTTIGHHTIHTASEGGGYVLVPILATHPADGVIRRQYCWRSGREGCDIRNRIILRLIRTPPSRGNGS